MANKKKRSQAMSDSSDEEILIGTLPHMALLPGGRPIKVATPRILVPRGVCPPVTGQSTTGQPAIGHLPSGQENISEQLVTGHRSLVMDHWSRVSGHRSNGHYTRISSQSIIGQWPSTHRSLDLENINTRDRGSQYSSVTAQTITGHQSSEFISTYS